MHSLTNRLDGYLRRPKRALARSSVEAKRAVVDTAMRALGATFELVSERSPELGREIVSWEPGHVVELAVLPRGPAIALRKEGGVIRYLGQGRPSSGRPGTGASRAGAGQGALQATVSLRFKNLDAAFLTFTGQMATHTASIEHRVVVHGNVAHAMQANRAMAIVQEHLMPAALLNLTAKRPVRLGPAELRIKAGVLARLPARLASVWSRRWISA